MKKLKNYKEKGDKTMNKVRKVLDQLMRGFNVAVFALLTIITTWQVASRYLFNAPSTWSEELSSYLFAWVTLSGAAYVFGKRDHMNIPIVVDMLPVKAQRIIAVLGEVVILIFALSIMIYGGISITSLTMGQQSSSLSVAMGVFYAAIPITGVFIAIYNVLNIYDLVKGNPIGQDIVETEGEDIPLSDARH